MCAARKTQRLLDIVIMLLNLIRVFLFQNKPGDAKEKPRKRAAAKDDGSKPPAKRRGRPPGTDKKEHPGFRLRYIIFDVCFLFWLQSVAIVQPVACQISNIIDLFHAMRSCIPWLQTIKIVSIVLVPARNIQTRTLFAHATNRSQLRRCSAWYFASPPPSFPHKRRLNFDAFAFSKAQEGRKQWKRGLGVSRQDRVERSA